MVVGCVDLAPSEASVFRGAQLFLVKHHQWATPQIQHRGVQWKQGVVAYVILCVVSLHNATPVHRTPLPLHPPLLNIISYYSISDQLGRHVRVDGHHRGADGRPRG